MIKVAIDGCVGCGKTALAKGMAKKLGKDFVAVNTGSIFRALAYAYDKAGLGEISAQKLKTFLKTIDLQIKFKNGEQQTFVDGKNVEKYLRSSKIGLLSAKICAYKDVRRKYEEIARFYANNFNCVMEGRDIATVIMPDADVKIFLTASAEVRAQRRLKDFKAKKEKITLEEVSQYIEESDRLYNERVVSLMPEDDSHIVDNSHMEMEELVNYCCNLVREEMSKKKPINITIDGNVCSGKSTIARALAKRLGFAVFDTGALYRGIACAFEYMKLDENKINEKYINDFAKQIHIKVEFVEGVQHVLVNGIDYTPNLRTERISELVAKISPFVSIRKMVLEMQRDYAKNHDIVMEGRDIGSFVLPNADFKFFCTADENVRAKRRFEQQKAMGYDVVFADVLRELKERDYKDTHREHGAITILPESIIIDTTNQSLEQSVEFCIKAMNERKKEVKRVKLS